MLRTTTQTSGGKGLPPYWQAVILTIATVGRQPFADIGNPTNGKGPVRNIIC